MGIKDRDTRAALETLNIEIENYEAVIDDKDKEIFELQETIMGLKHQVDEYESRITELEEALAESYLTSEADDERDNNQGDLPLQCGRSSDVLDTGND